MRTLRILVFGCVVTLSASCGRSHQTVNSDASQMDTGPGTDSGVPADTATPDAPSSDSGSADAGVCVPITPTRILAPLAVTTAQSIEMTALVDDPGRCSCEPQLGNGVESNFSLSVCNCCDLCECIDRGYEAGSEVIAPPELEEGALTIFVEGASADVTVRADQEYGTATPTQLEIVETNGYRQTGAHYTWLSVQGEFRLCCVEPVPIVVQESFSDGTFNLRLEDASLDPCDCIGELSAFETFVNLGELAPGDYTARFDDSTSLDFTVE